MTFKDPVCEKISTRRGALGLRQEDLAALIGVSKSAMSRLEAGKIEINIVTLRKIAGALSVPVAELLEDDAQKLQLPENEATLLAHYKTADERGRQVIELVARNEYLRNAGAEQL